MKVKIVKSCAGIGFAYRTGQVVSADDPGVRELLDARLAVPVRTAAVETAMVKPVETAVVLTRRDYEAMTKNDLVVRLARSGVEFNKRQTKAELIDLLLGGGEN